MRRFMFKFLFSYFKNKKRNEIFYIANGTEILPEKLSTSEEIELSVKMKNGDRAARCELIERNLRLVVYTAQKFISANDNIEDLISIGTIGLIKAVESFDAEKNIKMATYASRCIENEILMHLRKLNKIRKEVSLDEPLNTDAEGNELCIADVLTDEENTVSKNLDKEDETSNLKLVLNSLSNKEKEIMCMRYGLTGKEEMTQKQVADYFEISQSYISRIEKKILSKMKTEILKLA
ncbi:MAG: sigma-70 family RNA polymerase sigma factor [Clostridia bacterium]|nr:sigma-70 family RNA polymerase sigma factor [Clostridia bacterium]